MSNHDPEQRLYDALVARGHRAEVSYGHGIGEGESCSVVRIAVGGRHVGMTGEVLRNLIDGGYSFEAIAAFVEQSRDEELKRCQR